MKINYDEIITKANDRKNKLQALSIFCEDLPLWRERHLDSLGYFTELYMMASKLDLEGRALISPDIESYRGFFISGVNDMKVISVKGQGSRSDGFNRFLDAFK